MIPFLATMWEGIIKSKVEKNEKKFKEKCKDLVDENGYDEVFCDFFNNLSTIQDLRLWRSERTSTDF